MPQRTPVPPVDYTSKDWATFRDDMEDAIAIRLPEWTSRSPSDFGIVLIELFAYVGDILSFYGDRIANEAFLPTAVLRSSVLAIAKMLDYRPTLNLAATTSLTFTVRSGAGAVTIPAGTQVSTVPAAGQTAIVFETDAALVIADSTPWTGTVTATQGKTITLETLGTSDGSLGQVFALFFSPVVDSSENIFVDEGAGAMAWTFYENLIDAAADTAAYTTYSDENGVLNIQFGDNVNGRVPSNGAIITATYRVGGGAVGNIGANTLTLMVGTVSNVTAVTNPPGVGGAGAVGGADAETLDDIRDNAPRSLTTIDRAVTLADYANLAIKVPGVAKANAQAAVYTNVSLYIAPTSSSVNPVADANTKQKVQDYLAGRKMVNATITILDPTYVPINIATSGVGALNVLPQFNREAVRLDVEKAIRSLLAYTNVNFASRIALSDLYKAAQSVTGVAYVVFSILARTPTGLADVQLAYNEIPSAGTILIDPLTTTGGITTT